MLAAADGCVQVSVWFYLPGQGDGAVAPGNNHLGLNHGRAFALSSPFRCLIRGSQKSFEDLSPMFHFKFNTEFPSKEALLGGLFVATVLSMVPFSATARDFIAEYDQARLLRLKVPAEQVIVGNPSIADVAVQSRKLLVITGKTFGVTNLIVLDNKDNVLLSKNIVVRNDNKQVVNLQRGVTRQSYNCTPVCQPSLVIGDESKYYNRVISSAQQKMKISAAELITLL